MSTTITFVRDRIPHYDDPAAVGARILRARQQAGLTQRELAFPGCSCAYISRIERGERVPSLQVMREIAQRTNVSDDWIAYGRELVAIEVTSAIAALRAASRNGANVVELANLYDSLAGAAATVRDLLEETVR